MDGYGSGMEISVSTSSQIVPTKRAPECPFECARGGVGWGGVQSLLVDHK